MTPGQKMAERRAEYGHSQRALAKVLGVSHVTLGQWERGVRPVPERFRVKLEELLILDFASLFPTCPHCGHEIPHG